MTEPLTLAQRLRDGLCVKAWLHHDNLSIDLPATVLLLSEAADELDRLRDANKALTAERDDITGTLKYCEECWSDERGTMIDKIQFERARAAEAHNTRLSEALERAKLTMERYRRAGLGDDVFHSDLVDSINHVDATLSGSGAGGWRTMDSAPKDGTEFLALNKWRRPRKFAWSEHYNYWLSTDGQEAIRAEYQTDYVWIDLPSAPQPKGE